MLQTDSGRNFFMVYCTCGIHLRRLLCGVSCCPPADDDRGVNYSVNAEGGVGDVKVRGPDTVLSSALRRISTVKRGGSPTASEKPPDVGGLSRIIRDQNTIAYSTTGKKPFFVALVQQVSPGFFCTESLNA